MTYLVWDGHPNKASRADSALVVHLFLVKNMEIWVKPCECGPFEAQIRVVGGAPLAAYPLDFQLATVSPKKQLGKNSARLAWLDPHTESIEVPRALSQPHALNALKCTHTHQIQQHASYSVPSTFIGWPRLKPVALENGRVFADRLFPLRVVTRFKNQGQYFASPKYLNSKPDTACRRTSGMHQTRPQWTCTAQAKHIHSMFHRQSPSGTWQCPWHQSFDSPWETPLGPPLQCAQGVGVPQHG